MSRRLIGTLGLAALLLGFTPAAVFAQSYAASKEKGLKESKALAERIDKIIHNRLQQEKVKPGPAADAAQFARRLHIDLAGKIPSLLEIRDYLENDSATKLEDRVDELLAAPHFANNFTHYYRSFMLSGSNNIQAQAFQFQFEGWLRNRLANNTTYDKIAHELISAQPFNQGGFTPSAFYFVNENKPENLAGATARVFLGVKIECAQCHKHPFAKWTRQQFWEYAAFFSGIQPNNGRPKGQPINPDSREIKIPDSDKVAQAKFITGEEPKWTPGMATRTVLADWVTSPKNPYFAKAAVDHVWQYFFGVSLTEPIFEPTDDSPPAHPELLDELAKSFTASGYDLKFLIRAIVLTEAYQRASVSLSSDTKDDIQLFARMPVRGMMPEQLFDSFAEATDYPQDQNYNDQFRQPNFGQPNTPRQQFLAKFTSQDKRIETQTSILQALYLMNGKFLAERTKLENNKSLETIATAPTTTSRRVETMYLMVLSRLPRADETARMVRYIESGGGTNDPRQAVADIYWALLNSSEFMLNH
jgi:hypothetical protein